MGNIEDDKNPANNDGKRPLHLAASQGHFEVCKLIVENIEDNKHPTTKSYLITLR